VAVALVVGFVAKLLTHPTTVVDAVMVVAESGCGAWW